jgi:hypothetical protein
VIGADRAWLPLVLLALLVAAAAAGGWYAYRKRPRPVAVVPSTPPRDRALAELERIRRSGLLESGQYKAFGSAVADVVRVYLADLSPDWGTDLTTTELAFAMRADTVPLPARIADARTLDFAGPGDASDPAVSVIRLLGAADVLKFTGVAGTAAGAERLWSRARAWVGANDSALRRAA